MPTAADFTKLVPGFDFLQGLMKNAGAGLPNMGQWIAPTLDPDELEKRIGELKTVQFWLEQNVRLLGTTIQALEVQRMTLATLRTMNMPMAKLRESLEIKSPFGEGATAVPSFMAKDATPEAPAEPPAAPTAEPEPAPARGREAAGGKASAPEQAGRPGAGGVVDPMQWWGALTQQFTELAANAIKETGQAGERVSAMVRPAMEAAGQMLERPTVVTPPAPAPAAAPAKRAAAAKKRAPARKRKA